MNHIKFSDLKFPDPTAREAVIEGGGKSLAELFGGDEKIEPYLADADSFLSAEDALDPVKKEKFLQGLHHGTRPKIVRACITPDLESDHPGDFAASFDLLPSRKHNYEKEEVRDSIDLIRRFVDDEAASKHYDWEGGNSKNLAARVGFRVQDDHGYKIGSILEHPSEAGMYSIELTEAVEAAEKRYRVNVKDGKIIAGGLLDSSYIFEIIDLYKRIADSGKIPVGFSFQLEYGVDNANRRLKLYQVRLFRKKEDRADFDLYDNDIDLKEYSEHYHAFGKTDKEGIIIPIGYFNEQAVEYLRDRSDTGYFYHDGISNRDHCEPDLRVMPNNMDLFWFDSAGGGGAYQTHGAMRGLSKANYGMVLSPSWALSLFDEPINDPDDDIRTVRYVSDGIKAGVKYEGDWYTEEL